MRKRAPAEAALPEAVVPVVTKLQLDAHRQRHALRNTEITEACTEQSQDYITVHVEANLEDFTIDEKSGITVAGSKSDLVDFEEFWTFSRPVGPNRWKLTAVQQP